jgi:hypothetical protein
MAAERVRLGIGAVVACGILLMAGSGGRAAEPPLMRDVELEALQEAVRWPDPDPRTTVTLVGRFLAARRDQEAYAYFRERAQSAPDRPIFLALEGFFQARVADDVFLLRRVAWVNDAVAKLDRAVALEPGSRVSSAGSCSPSCPPVSERPRRPSTISNGSCRTRIASPRDSGEASIGGSRAPTLPWAAMATRKPPCSGPGPRHSIPPPRCSRRTTG